MIVTPPAASNRSWPLPASITSAMAGARIMVVDDVAANVDVLKRLLSYTGAGQVYGYTDPRMALAELAGLAPDLVLLDLHMPGLNGIEFLTQVRRRLAPNQFLPVIVVTADITDDTRREVLAAGAKDFVTKPFDSVEVMLRVGNMLETARLHASMRKRSVTLQAQLDVERARQLDEDRLQQVRLERVEAAMHPGGVAMVYQPFVSLSDGRIVGAEALARFAGKPPRPPSLWFTEAEQVGRLGALELHAIDLALAGFRDLPATAFLSVNISAETAASPSFVNLLGRVPASRLVVELTEHTRIQNFDAVLAALAPFRSRGGRIAIDDAGAGYSGLQQILRLSPDIIKLDIALIKGIDRDPARRALASSLVQFAGEFGATLIAEGIETADELAQLVALGVPWGQGYYLARPGPMPLQLESQAKNLRAAPRAS